MTWEDKTNKQKIETLREDLDKLIKLFGKRSKPDMLIMVNGEIRRNWWYRRFREVSK